MEKLIFPFLLPNGLLCGTPRAEGKKQWTYGSNGIGIGPRILTTLACSKYYPPEETF
jgi:hypothetical protein